MDTSRRKFLTYAGVSVLGLAAMPAVDAWASDTPYVVSSKQLKATRWAMVVDTTKLNSEADFAPLIEACHSIHNVPDIPTKQNIKWIWYDERERVFPDDENPYMAEAFEHKNYLLLCNHCFEPPCVRVCPTKATVKREDGIVMMDFHRCIGCRYCMAGCPYGARSFNFMDPRLHLDAAKENKEFPTRTKGVVEKCNFCYERLADGKLPACVEASKGALIFGDLDDPKSEVRKVLKERYSIRRKPSIGTQPNVYYLI